MFGGAFFLPFQSVCDIILAGGGIPTYPFLADNVNGEYTDFEGIWKVSVQLRERVFIQLSLLLHVMILIFLKNIRVIFMTKASL